MGYEAGEMVSTQMEWIQKSMPEMAKAMDGEMDLVKKIMSSTSRFEFSFVKV